MKLFFCIILTIFWINLFPANTQELFIIIPGTWSAQSTWCMAGGDFFNALQKSPFIKNKHVITFRWSSNNTHQARLTAAQELAALIKSYPSSSTINLVTHSHGTTVAILASHLLEKHCIRCIYALGTPVNEECYSPNMNIITYFYHFFSFSDFVQPVLGLFKRTFLPHERIANLAIAIDDKEPLHTSLHSPLIAQWLPAMHRILSYKKIGNFEQFSFNKPGIINFYTDTTPKYSIDSRREEHLEEDRLLITAFTLSLVRNKK